MRRSLVYLVVSIIGLGLGAPRRTASPSPTPPPPADAIAKVLAWAGPTTPRAGVPAALGWYETAFKHYADSQWRAFGPRWDAGNSAAGYDRASIYYVWGARTGDTAYYWPKAHAIAQDYGVKYLDNAGCNPQPHWYQGDGLYLDWLVYGDTASKRRLLCVPDHMIVFAWAIADTSKDWLDSRIRARTLLAFWIAEKLGAYKGVLDTLVPKVLKQQNAKGFWGYKSTCYGSWNFMDAMLDDMLIRLYEQRKPDPAILSAVTKSVNYLWTTQWRAGEKTFNYASVNCQNAGGPTPATDLNGFFLPAFGWLGKKTGDPAWFEHGDAILAGGRGASVYLYKQFSESYTSSYRYFGWRYAP
jgi:hypothetical protein